MSHSASLVIFTLLGQCAAGMVIFICFQKKDKILLSWVAALILALAALASLGHLSAPFSSWRTLANVGSSWLSREILCCILFGAAIVAHALFQRAWLCWLAAILGIIFVYVMSKVYIIPTEPAWDSSITFWYFLATSLLLGATIMLLALEIHNKTKDRGSALLGRWPLIIICAMAFSLVVAFMQISLTNKAASFGQIFSIACLVAGGGIGILALGRHASRLTISRGEAIAQPTNSMIAWTCIVVAIIWCAEVCSRYGFYQSYTWFGM